MPEFWWGVLTPFLILAAIAVLFILAALAHKLWSNLDRSLWVRVDLPKNTRVFRFDDEDEDEKPEYLDAANKMRDALLNAPRLRTVRGLGWMVLFVRNWEAKK